MNALDQLMAQVEDSRQAIKDRVSKAVGAKKTMEMVRIEELKSAVSEVKSLMSDSRFDRTQEFMKKLREGLSGCLERLAATGGDSAEINRIGAQLFVIDQIRNEPMRLVKELERLEKGLK